MRRMIAPILAATLLIAGGCSLLPGAPTAEIDGDWVLVEGVHEGTQLQLVDGAAVTMTIGGTTINGTSACNHYGGEIERDGGMLSIGALVMTEMGCEEPIATLESTFLAALAAIDSAERSGDRLTLRGPRSELGFTVVVPEPDAELEGTTWMLESLITGDAVASVMAEATVVFAGDGTFAGSTGCRSFGGTYEVDGTTLRTAEIIVDMRACTEEIGSQDGHVLDVLEASPSIAIDGGRLTLQAGERGLSYVASDA